MEDGERDPESAPGSDAGPRAEAGPRRSWLGLLVVPLIIASALLSSGPLPAVQRSLDDALDLVEAAWPRLAALVEPRASAAPTTGATETPTTGPTSSAGPTGAPSPGATARPSPPRADDDYLLMPRATLAALPTSGPAWERLLAVADAPLGRPDLTDQDERHGVRTLAVALVYARTGDPTYRDRARDAIMAAIGTERIDAGNAILALGRQLAAYVLAADFIDLGGADDAEFRDWLAGIRTRTLGGHGRWISLVGTHEDSANNWGAFAGAARIAASRYLGDTAEVERAARVLAGFLGDRSAWDAFQPVEDSVSWACDTLPFTPINPPCTAEGIDLDGAIVRDISRGGRLRWPPGDSGIGYTLESLQGLTLQAELLYQGGFGDPWSWSDEALRRAARIVTASGAAGGETWNRSDPSRHVPWLLNARYDLDLPTEPAGFGRTFGYTDWLYGS